MSEQRITSLDSVSNAEYYYISKAIECKKENKPNVEDSNKPNTPGCCGNYDYCKYCENISGEGCVTLEQDVQNDINRMANIIAARLRDIPAIEDDIPCKDKKYDFWEKEHEDKGC